MTRSCSALVANNLQEIPGATSSQSGSSQSRRVAGCGLFDVSDSIRSSSRSQIDVDGRSTAIGQASKGIDEWTQGLQLLSALRTCRDVRFHGGGFAER